MDQNGHAPIPGIQHRRHRRAVWPCYYTGHSGQRRAQPPAPQLVKAELGEIEFGKIELGKIELGQKEFVQKQPVENHRRPALPDEATDINYAAYGFQVDQKDLHYVEQ